MSEQRHKKPQLLLEKFLARTPGDQPADVPSTEEFQEQANKWRIVRDDGWNDCIYRVRVVVVYSFVGIYVTWLGWTVWEKGYEGLTVVASYIGAGLIGSILHEFLKGNRLHTRSSMEE